MNEPMNYTALVEEIRDIFLDSRTNIYDRTSRDEDGVHYDYELESTKEQDLEVENLIRKTFCDKIQKILDRI